MAQIAKEFGVPHGIIGKMVVTPPDQMVWLDAADLKSMNVDLIPFERSAVQGPQKFGYDVHKPKAAPAQKQEPAHSAGEKKYDKLFPTRATWNLKESTASSLPVMHHC
jgi:hypothetical protein